MAQRFRLRDIALFQRSVPFRLPFHVAGTVIDSSRQYFAFVRIELEGGWTGVGCAGEAPAPIWFDKVRPAEVTGRDLVDSIRVAADGYLAHAGPVTAYGLAAAHYAEQMAWAARRGAPRTVASFGAALIDSAILDALCRARGVSVFTALNTNLPGIDARLCPDLRGFDLDGWLASKHPLERIAIRHTIGGDDPLTTPSGAPDDGLPHALTDIIRAYGNRHFKIKIGADVAATVDRLHRIADVLETLPDPWFVTLDGNEAFTEAAPLEDLLGRLAAHPGLAGLRRRLMYVEQPIHRSVWRSVDVSGLGVPVIVDETDGDLDDFPFALTHGYAGVSAKTCKGVYKALLNAARCERAPRRRIIAAEDMNHPAGLTLQQDLAVALFLGLTHAEKNGHHYIDGMAHAPAAEQDAFLAAHPDLYRRGDGAVRLRIAAGEVACGSLVCPGFAAQAVPRREHLHPVPSRVAGDR